MDKIYLRVERYCKPEIVFANMKSSIESFEEHCERAIGLASGLKLDEGLYLIVISYKALSLYNLVTYEKEGIPLSTNFIYAMGSYIAVGDCIYKGTFI